MPSSTVHSRERRCAAQVDFRAQSMELGGTYVGGTGIMQILASIPVIGTILTGPRGEGVFGITLSHSRFDGQSASGGQSAGAAYSGHLSRDLPDGARGSKGRSARQVGLEGRWRPGIQCACRRRAERRVGFVWRGARSRAQLVGRDQWPSADQKEVRAAAQYALPVHGPARRAIVLCESRDDRGMLPQVRPYFLSSRPRKDPMEKRKLGKSAMEVAPLMFGGNVFGWTADEATSFKLLDGFVGAGFNFIDTADVYSRWVPGHKGGESETIIGNWLKARGGRDKVVIATKVGMEMPGDGKGLREGLHHGSAVEDSLRRLQTDYIDLYQSHKDDPATPLEETLGAFEQLIKQGKVRAIGASNYTRRALAEALERQRRQEAAALRDACSRTTTSTTAPASRRELEPLCLKENIGVIPYYSLAAAS